MRSIINKIKFFGLLLNHPLNRGHKAASLMRYLRWQVGSRLAPGAVAVDYVNDAKLLIEPGMTGATLNIYTGLHEFEDMAFVLHCLKKEDVFVDIGANVGSYSVLAGSVVGAKCISIEPIPGTFQHLINNININDISNSVTALNIGVSDNDGNLRFTTMCDTVNHVLSDYEQNNTESTTISVKKIDSILSEIDPTLIKIDVEGFETRVIKGAHDTLQKKSLIGVIVELLGSDNRYGFDESDLHKQILSYGFLPYKYFPFDREVVSLDGKNCESGNTLYLRNIDEVRSRIAVSPKYYLQQVHLEI